MPGEITIYWDGYGKIPAVIDTLPSPMREQVLSVIQQKRNELIEPGDTTPMLLGMLGILLLFLSIGWYVKNKQRKSSGNQEHTT